MAEDRQMLGYALKGMIAERERLDAEINELNRRLGTTSPSPRKKTAKKTRKMTAAQKKALSQAMKKAWARRKKAAKR